MESSHVEIARTLIEKGILIDSESMEDAIRLTITTPTHMNISIETQGRRNENCSIFSSLPIPSAAAKTMASNAQPLPDKVPCIICGKDLDPAKPLQEEAPIRELSSHDGFYCRDCWLRELRTKTAQSLLAKTLDRVLLDWAVSQSLRMR